MNLSIFKAYDIRGLCPGELEPEDGLAIGRAVARFLGGGPVVIAHDMRDTSDALRDAVCRGLLAEGVEVIEIGRGPTPMLYYAVTSLGAMGGVMVTASHNPGRYNGLKICGREARPIGRDTGLRPPATGNVLPACASHIRCRRCECRLPARDTPVPSGPRPPAPVVCPPALRDPAAKPACT